MKQYIPSWMELPELGSVRELVNREGELKALGVVYGHLPKERMVLIRELKLSEKGTAEFYKVCIDQLTAHSDIERQDDKWIPEVQDV